MKENELIQGIATAIAQATGVPFQVRREQTLGGGCINSVLRLEGDGARYFVKLNEAGRTEMFAAEAESLRELAAARAVRVPGVVCHGEAGGSAFLVLEALDLTGCSAVCEERLGQELARLHRATSPAFGWRRDNTIGSTPQLNTPSADWVAFWRMHRLGYQLKLARDNGIGAQTLRRGEQLLDRLEAFFTRYRPRPSLLHGDLWDGNHGALADGTPVIFDPAVYYGDREADLAMTELFGGFSARFYSAYREAWPLDDGYRTRKQLYNLYHVLNHFNLFGGGYGGQAGRMIEALLAETAS